MEFVPRKEFETLVFSVDGFGFSCSLTRLKAVFVTPLLFLLPPSLQERKKKTHRCHLSGITMKWRIKYILVIGYT